MKYIFILILILAGQDTQSIPPGTIINSLTLTPQQKSEFLIPIRRAINITIKSTDGIPFIAKIYKRDGLSLKCQDKIDYIEIENSADKVTVKSSNISSIIAILTTIVVIIYEKKSVPTKVMLLLFLMLQLEELPYNIKVSERVFKKLLF